MLRFVDLYANYEQEFTDLLCKVIETVQGLSLCCVIRLCSDCAKLNRKRVNHEYLLPMKLVVSRK